MPKRRLVYVFIAVIATLTFLALPRPAQAGGCRLLIHNATFGGGATKDVTVAGGQAGPRVATLREIEIYGK